MLSLSTDHRDGRPISVGMNEGYKIIQTTTTITNQTNIKR